MKKRKYVVFGQGMGMNDGKPFICYRTPNCLSPDKDEPKRNQYPAENCLCSKKEAKRTVRTLSNNFPEVSYAVKKFL